MKLFLQLFVYFLLLMSTTSWSQSLVEDANLATNPVNAEGVFTETIKIISNSKKIFILTNTNQQLGTGDFISLALDNNLAARAVVGKVHQGQVGIKILKIYSMAQWGRLRRNQDVQIIRGDDSLFGKKAQAPKTDTGPATAQIRSEEDLYSGDVVIDEEAGTFEENKNRHIKPDNVVAATGAFYEAAEVASKGGKVRTTEFGISWAYQFADNYFVEGLYGRALFNSYPIEGASTLVNHLTARLKYNIKGPLYTFFMPYVGFHTRTVSSPDAATSSNEQSNVEQQEAIDTLKKSGPVFGVTIMRRLVPGWFIKTDLGSDIINLGFAIEF